ncbi:MAG: hypothetical protein U1F60_01500 [Planctomycetota bacterium]
MPGPGTHPHRLDTGIVYGRRSQHAYGLGHLVVAGFFGGVPAACWLLHRNEGLRESPTTPWLPLAWLAFLVEAATLFCWVYFRLDLPMPLLAGAEAFGLLIVAIVAHRRYRQERRRYVPAPHQDAAWIGWVFVGFRCFVGATAWWLRATAA